MPKDRLEVKPTIEWDSKPNRKYFLKYLIEQNNFCTMAEVGVRDGRTTFFLLNNIPNLTIYAIDKDISLFYNAHVKSQYGNRLIPIQGDSSLVSKNIPDVDLIFIDADHSYEGCSKDIKAYEHKVKDGGVLSGHDIDFVGVNRAVKHFVKSYDVGPNNVWFKFI